MLGTTDDNYIKNLKYLMNEFLEEPPYCYRGRVFGVQPNNIFKGFTTQEQDNFVITTANVPFKGELMYYDEESDVYELKLNYVCNDSELEATLYKKEICKPIPERILKNRANLPIPPRFYLMPTHEMIETGQYPSYETLINLDASGIDFAQLVNTNFFLNVSEITPRIVTMLKNVNQFVEIKKNFTEPK